VRHNEVIIEYGLNGINNKVKYKAQGWFFFSPEESPCYMHVETILFTDGTKRCGCRQYWTGITSDGSRSCKHTRYVDQGIADTNCVSSHDYTAKNQTNKPPTNKSHASKEKEPERKLGQRKFQLE